MEPRRFDALRAALAANALAAPLHGLRGGHIQQLVGTRVDGHLPAATVLHPDHPDRNRLPGLHGIEGQRLLATLTLAIDDGSGREPHARPPAALLDLAGDDPSGHGALRTPGRPLRRALERWRADYPWAPEDFHAPPEQSSEGIAPTIDALGAALVLPDPAAASAAAIALARTTHARPLPLAGAWLIAHLVPLLANRPLTRPGQPATGLLTPLAPALREFELAERHARRDIWRRLEWTPPPATLADLLPLIERLLTEADDDLARRTLLANTADLTPAQPVTHCQHGFLPTGLGWALYRGLGHRPPSHALEDILNAGGETAPIATLAAALLALRHGLAHFPEEWLTGTHVLAALPAWGPPTTPDWLTHWAAAERQWTAREEALRAPLRAALKARQDAEPPRPRPAANRADQEDAPFAPPPHLWLKHGESEDDPEVKKRLKAARGKRRIDWKEDRRRQQHDDPT
jgi:ADP-ribosylglycohydrolase